MDALTNRLGTRFLIVSVVPNALLIAYLSLLVAAGAPTRDPSLSRAIKILDGLTIRQIVVIVLGLLVVSVATHPLQIPLIQFLEGHWQRIPLGSKAARYCTERFRAENRQAVIVLSERGELSVKSAQKIVDIKDRLRWLPLDEKDFLPTELGNTLFVGETRAGDRYGLELDVAMARLYPLLSSGASDELGDKRDQMDAAARLCIAAGLAAAATIGLLIERGPWLFLALAPYLLAWISYRAAVAGARTFSNSLAAAVDMHHLELFDALHLQRPVNLAHELEINKVVVKLFRGGHLNAKAMDRITYTTTEANQPSHK
jgi:hypothetical protein